MSSRAKTLPLHEVARGVTALGVVFAALFATAPCVADTLMSAVPTGWRLQTYTGSVVAAYYTPSSCTSGEITFSPSATVDDKNRFWALVMSAKSTGQAVGISYDNSGSCQITSFYEQ